MSSLDRKKVVGLIRAKIGRPSGAVDVVLRSGVLRLLDEAVTRPLTLLSAPAGFGKTSAVASWIASSRAGTRTAWLSLDEDDADPFSFVRYVIAAIQKVHAGFGHRLLASVDGAGPMSARSLVTQLVGEIEELAQDTVLVLDDYESIQNEEIDCAIVHLVECLPDHFRLVVLTRTTPRFPLAAWRTAGLASCIPAKELLFSLDDAAAFLTGTMGLSIDSKTAEKIWERTEGWIAGLQMAALSYRDALLETQGDEELGPGHRDDDRHVAEYFKEQVLSKLPADVRDFLTATSVLQRLCPSLCDAVRDRSDGAAMLVHAERANMFIMRLDENGEWYRYHHLFADLMRRGLAPEAEASIHRKASAWLEAHGFAAAAFKHAIAAGDIARAVVLFRTHVEDEQQRGEHRTLLTWLCAIPDDVVRANADLAAHKCWLLYLVGRSRDAREYAKHATISQAEHLPRRQQALVRVVQTYLALNWGDPTLAAGIGAEALEYLGPEPSFYRALTLSFCGQAEALLGKSRAALTTLQEAFEVGETIQARSRCYDALAHLAGAMERQGRLREAIALCSAALEGQVDGCGRSLPVTGPVFVALGSLLYQANELDRAERYLDQGLDLCQRRGILYYVVCGQAALAKVKHAKGERAAAWDTLALARDAAERSGSPRRLHFAGEATVELQLAEGNILAAQRSFQDIVERGQSAAVRESLVHAKLLVAQRRQEAVDTLKRLRDNAERQGAEGKLIEIGVLQACWEAISGRYWSVGRYLEPAVSLAATSGFRRPFLTYGRELASSLPKFHVVAPDFVEGLLAVLSTAVATQSARLYEQLTKQELQLVRLLPLGLKNQEIAVQLLITEGTAKQYLNRIFRKLDVRNRTEAVTRAQQLGLLRH